MGKEIFIVCTFKLQNFSDFKMKSMLVLVKEQLFMNGVVR